MYKLSVKSEFSSAHNLRGYKGKCEALHGHNWKVEVVLQAKEPDKRGLVLDFQEIKRVIKNTLQKIDHTYLNKIPYFKKHNPTSENLACYLFEEFSSSFKLNKAIKLAEVTVWESDNCSATYFK